MLSRVIVGSRTSIFSTLLLVAVITVLGTAVGVFCGWNGRWMDTVLMRISDMFLAFPGLVFALAVAGSLGGGLQNAILAYPDKGYGARFNQWLYEDDPQPYRSYGNGSAMRVSPAAWLAESMQEALHLAQLTAEVTHDHPEGIKGAQAVAAAIFLARTGHSKVVIKAYVECKFGYDLSRTCDAIRPTYHHAESCQETVPQAIAAFLESTDFEDALRTAVSLGGDSDTLAAITGSIAEAFYGVPEDLKQECRKQLTPELEEILQACENMILQR